MALSVKISDTVTLTMVAVQILAAVMNVGYKLCANDGMNLSVLVAYRFMCGTAFIVPVALFVERNKRPKLNKTVIFYGFLCGLLGGSLGQNLFLKGLALTSATFATSIVNMSPVITFILAVCLRLEKLSLDSTWGQIKVCGTLLAIGGAMLLTFYKGPSFNIWKTHINLLELTRSNRLGRAKTHFDHNLPLGAFLCLASCVSYSFWLVIQAKAVVSFPCPYSLTAMMTTWASVQGLAYALCVEKDRNQWILGWDGVLGSGLMFVLVVWCVRMRGPVFVSAFKPLVLVLVAIAGSLFLEEKLNLGMLLGSILVICGLYFVLWGKRMELKMTSQVAHENQEDRENT